MSTPTRGRDAGSIEDGIISGPPHHGIARGFKVGKEEIAGLVAALAEYVVRDFAAEYAGWVRELDTIVTGLHGFRGISAVRVDPAPDALPQVPIVQVTVDDAVTGVDAAEVVNRLQAGDPIVVPVENWTRRGIIGFLPQSLLPGDAVEIVAAVRTAVRALSLVG